jgi:hypothetical protein
MQRCHSLEEETAGATPFARKVFALMTRKTTVKHNIIGPLQQIWDLSSDLNVILRMTDAAASDWNETVICIIYPTYQFAYFRYIFLLTVDLCIDATPS